MHATERNIQLRYTHTIIRLKTDSRNSSSSASDVKISSSFEILIKMVKACCAIGYSSPQSHMGAQNQYHSTGISLNFDVVSSSFSPSPRPKSEKHAQHNLESKASDPSRALIA